MQNQQLNSTTQNIFHTDAVRILRLSPYMDYLAVVIDRTLSVFHLKKSLNYSILLTEDVTNIEFLASFMAIRFINGTVTIYQIKEHQTFEIQIYENIKENIRILYGTMRHFFIMFESSIVSYSSAMIKMTTNIENAKEEFTQIAAVSDEIYLATKQKLFFLQGQNLKQVEIKAEPLTIIGTINYLIVVLNQGYCQLVSHGNSKGFSPILIQFVNPIVQLKPQLFKYTCNEQYRECLWMNCGNCLTEIEVGPIQNYNSFFNFVYYVKRIVLQQLIVDYDVTYSEPNLIMFRNQAGLKKLNVLMEQLPHPEDFKRQDIKSKEYPKPKKIKQKESKESKTLKRANEPTIMNREEPLKKEEQRERRDDSVSRSGETNRTDSAKKQESAKKEESVNRSESAKKEESANEIVPEKRQESAKKSEPEEKAELEKRQESVNRSEPPKRKKSAKRIDQESNKEESTENNPFFLSQKKTQQIEKKPKQQKSSANHSETKKIQEQSPAAPPPTPNDQPITVPKPIQIPPKISPFQARPADQIPHKVVQIILEDEDGDTFSQGQDIRHFISNINSSIESTVTHFNTTITQTMNDHTSNLKKQLKSISEEFVNNATLQALQATKKSVSTYIKGELNTRLQNYFKELFKQTWQNQQTAIDYLSDIRKKEKEKQQIVNNDMLHNNILKIQGLLEQIKKNTKSGDNRQVEELMTKLNNLNDKMSQLTQQQGVDVEQDAKTNTEIMQKLHNISQLMQGSKAPTKKKYLIIRKSQNN